MEGYPWPQTYSSSKGRVRYKTRSALVPFGDDASLVAVRYDETKEAEPPIPMVPPRSPRRPRPKSEQTVTSIDTTVSRQPGPLVITPPRPRPPTEQHPALRTITSPKIEAASEKRLSGLAATISSGLSFLQEDSEEEEEEDLWAYEKFSLNPYANVAKAGVEAIHVQPLRLNRGTTSPTSIYSQDCAGGVSNTGSRSSTISIPLRSPSLSEGSTASPISPGTPPPPPQSMSPFILAGSESDKEEPTVKPASLLLRSFSLRSVRSGSSSPQKPKRLRKRSLVAAQAARLAPKQEIMDWDPELTPAGGSPPMALTDPAHGLIAAHARHPHPLGVFGPPETFSLDDDFSDFISRMTFSERGSVLFGGHRPHRVPATMSDHGSGIGAHESSSERASVAPRAFPLLPAATKRNAAPVAAIESTEPESHTSQLVQPEKGHAHANGAADIPTTNEAAQRPVTPSSASAGPVPSTPTSPRNPPSIRVMSSDMERESQKVRSLYDPGLDSLIGEDGGRHLAVGGHLEPTVEVPSEEEKDENDASSQSRDQSAGPRPGAHTRATGIPVSVASTVSQPDEALHGAHLLAGGVEDWEDVDGRDVDRYGFIVTRAPGSRSATPAELLASPPDSPRKRRNVLTRREPATNSGFLGVGRGPSRKVSARSLNTVASGMSTASRRSNRSAARKAANLLPHNSERRWADAAGDMLALQPGLTNVAEDETAEKLADDLKQREWKRAEKWRKMAKVVKRGKDGEGMSFEFDVTNSKLIERTWKGIPDRWRAAAWYSFLSTSSQHSSTPQDSDDELVTRYSQLQNEASPDDVQIDLDVPRTINQHIMFRKRYQGGQRLLFRVLHALSLYFPETGYVQGMASLAATFLSYYDEEQCFIMLVRLWQLRGLNHLYQPGFEELMGALKDFEDQWLAGKEAAKSLKELNIDPTAYGTRWYLTLFNLSVPFSAQLRIWDVFILLGSSPPRDVSKSDKPQPASSKGLEVLHATSVALILALQHHLVDAEFENAMKAVTSWVPLKDDDLLMKVVNSEYKAHFARRKM